MSVTLVVDDPILAPVFSGTHFPTSEEWIVDLTQQCEEIWRSNSMNYKENQIRVAPMVAERFSQYYKYSEKLVQQI